MNGGEKILLKIKRVFFICDYVANYGGNFLACLKNLSDFLSNKNIEVIYVFPLEAQQKRWEINLSNFNLVYISFDNKTIMQFLRNNLKTGDIVHTHFLNGKKLLSVKRAIKSKKLNIKVICHEHMNLDPQYGKIKEFLKNTIFHILFYRFYFIGVSPSVYKRLCIRYDFKKVFLVENAISVKRLNKKGKNPYLDRSKKNILIMGSAYSVKGIDIAIKAIDRDKYLRDQVNLNIITHTVNETKEKILDQFGEEVFSFVRVWPTDSEIQNYYNNSFLFLSPSRHEAFGYSNIEAAYCGDQVIASDVPGQNTLKKVPYIYWVKAENVDQLTDAIKKSVHKSSQKIEYEWRANKKYIIANYSLTKWTNKIYKVYLDIVKNEGH